MEQRIEALTDLKQLKQNLKECERQQKIKETELADIKTKFQASRDGNKAAIEEMAKLERNMLEKEFELKQIESEKNMRAEDAKLN